MPKQILLFLAGLVLLGRAFAAQPDPDRGLYAIWFKDDVLKLPYIKGGQVVCQWGELDRGEGKYDFSPLRARLEVARHQGLKVTVQVNGNTKPAWLFTKVPYYPKALDIQVRDGKGTLVWWHPEFLRAYVAFLTAYADFIKKSPYRDNLLGIRLNFNAIGTEHLPPPAEMRSSASWTVPPGVEKAPDFKMEFINEYCMKVVDTFVEQFGPFTRVFVRNNVKEDIRERYRNLFETGRLAWFHTSSEVEPHSAGTEVQYQTFLDDCRSGKTVGYAESWADAWGYHGKKDPRWCSPPQWNYWRLLSDLNMGISFIAVYGNDLSVALNGSHFREDASAFKDEFDAAFRFAAKYAGYHASPQSAPGAWVAFRHSTVSRLSNQKLDKLTGDYSFLARRLEDSTRGETNVGPDAQRYGAWARRLARGNTIRIALDGEFAKSLAGRNAKVNVIYLDAGEGSFETRAGGTSRKTTLGGSGQWKTASFTIPGAALTSDTAGAQVALETQSGDIAFHMVEIERE